MADNPESPITVELPSNIAAKVRQAMSAMWKAAWESGRRSALVKPGDPTELKLIKASEVEPKEIKWLWENRIPLGKLTLFVGDPDNGKSMAGTSVAAIVSTGHNWFDAKNTQPASEVLIFASEDDREDTIVPRLMAAGANRNNISFEELHAMRLDRDIELLRTTLIENRDIRLVVIDPVSNYLGNVKMNDEQAVRRALAPLQTVAAETSVSIVGIMHLNKKADLQAINRIGGAMAFVGVARAVWFFCRDKQNADEFGMLPVKKNIGRRAEGLTFRIDTVPVAIEGKPVEQPYVKWIGETEKSANDVLTQNVDQPREVDKAMDWLAAFLSDGPKRATEGEQAGKDAGFSESTLKRARQKLSVQSDKDGPVWYWKL